MGHTKPHLRPTGETSHIALTFRSHEPTCASGGAHEEVILQGRASATSRKSLFFKADFHVLKQTKAGGLLQAQTAFHSDIDWSRMTSGSQGEEYRFIATSAWTVKENA
jgi:hypothetical protein